MKRNATRRAVLLCLLVTLAAAGSGPAQESEEYAALAGKEQRLRAQLEHLREQQQYLLFEKALHASDSKYVLLNIRSGKGTLNYRNRILKSFSFVLKPSSRSPKPRSGPLLLSGKKEGRPRQRQLVFGNQVLVLRSAKSGAIAGMSSRSHQVSIGTKDLAAIFYALDNGSYLYIINESDK